jgi:predicted transposase/invertase (TIGR01784 family)
MMGQGSAFFLPEDEKQFREVEQKGLLPEKIDRFGDYFLKFLLAAPERKWLLLDLANTSLKLMGYNPLADIETMDRELSPNIADGRGLRLDYLGRTVKGDIVNLEFQNQGGSEFIKRAVFVSGTLVHRQLAQGDNFAKLCPTIFLGLLNFKLFDWDGWYWDFVLSNTKHNKALTEDLVIIFVEMTKLEPMIPELRRKAKQGELAESDMEARLALWGAYMTGKGVDVVMEVAEKDPVFAEVIRAERDYWGDSRNRFLQWQEEKRRLDAQTEIYCAKREGEAIGEARGVVIGEARGVAIGEARGEVIGEVRALEKFARSLLAENAPLDMIQRVTGLSGDEIELARRAMST